MRILVAGAGKIGRYLARDLSNRGHDVTVLERSASALDKVVSGVQRRLGDACAPSVLEAAGAREADVVVAATGDDEDNLVISLLCRQEFAVPRVLARVNYAENEWLFDEDWGVDVAVSPPHLLTALVEEDISEGDVVSLMKLRQGEAELLEVRLDELSEAAGRRVGDLELPPDMAVLAVLRRGAVTPCRDTTPLNEGDEVFVLVRKGGRDAVRRALLGAS